MMLWKSVGMGFLLVQRYAMDESYPSYPTTMIKNTNNISHTLVVQNSSLWLGNKDKKEKDNEEGRNNDTASTSNTTATIDVCDVFFETYWEARRKFWQAVHQLQQQQEQQLDTSTETTAKRMLPTNVALYWHVIVPTVARNIGETVEAEASRNCLLGDEVNTDPDDPDYTMDIAVIPGNVPGWVIHTSGMHGVEGYAGSAIQVAALQLLWQQLQSSSSSSSPPRPTLVLVHAVNPYGMAHDWCIN